MSMKKVPGTTHAARLLDESRRRKELITDADVWWKRLESDRPLTGKEVARLQYFLSTVKGALRAMD